MELSNVMFIEPPFDADSSIVTALPDNLVGLLRQINGFILLEGGLHLRGICAEPEWHSLASVLTGPQALHTLYPVLRESDVPFAQDCVADQYVLRDRVVHKLRLHGAHTSDKVYASATSAGPLVTMRYRLCSSARVEWMIMWNSLRTAEERRE